MAAVVKSDTYFGISRNTKGRLNPRHQLMVREKIRASALVNQLQGHVFGRIKLDSSQVRAALGLLAKCVPDLHHAELSGPNGGPIPVAALVAATDQDAMATYLAMLAKPAAETQSPEPTPNT